MAMSASAHNDEPDMGSERWRRQLQLLRRFHETERRTFAVLQHPQFRGFKIGQYVSFEKPSRQGVSSGTIAFLVSINGEIHAGVDIGQAACAVVPFERLESLEPM